MPMPRSLTGARAHATKLVARTYSGMRIRSCTMADTVARRIGPALVLLVFLVLGPTARGQDLAEFEKRLTKFTLDNGLTFLVLQRREVPVVSFHTYADVGAVDEVKGITGIAHLF